MSQIKELKLLKLRNLITSKELIVSSSNNDLKKYGEWQCNWLEAAGEINKEIDALISNLEVPF